MTSVAIDNDDNSLTIEVEPKVLTEVTFVCGGEAVGKVSSTHDFSDLPAELHQMGVSVIRQCGTRVWLDKEIYYSLCGTEEEKQIVADARQARAEKRGKELERTKHPFKALWSDIKGWVLSALREI